MLETSLSTSSGTWILGCKEPALERFFQILEIFWTDGAAADGAPTDGPTEADGSTAAGGAPPSSPAGAPTDGSTPAADESTVAPTVAADRQEGEDDGSNPLEPTAAEVLDPYMIPSQVAGEPKESSVEVSSSLEDLGSERAGDLVEPTPPHPNHWCLAMMPQWHPRFPSRKIRALLNPPQRLGSFVGKLHPTLKPIQNIRRFRYQKRKSLTCP